MSDHAEDAAREEQRRRMREALDKKAGRHHASAGAAPNDGSTKSHGSGTNAPVPQATHRKTGPGA